MAKTEWDFFGGMLDKAIKAKKKRRKKLDEGMEKQGIKTKGKKKKDKK